MTTAEHPFTMLVGPSNVFHYIFVPVQGQTDLTYWTKVTVIPLYLETPIAPMTGDSPSLVIAENKIF